MDQLITYISTRIPDGCCRNDFITPFQDGSIEATIVQPPEVWSAEGTSKSVTAMWTKENMQEFYWDNIKCPKAIATVLRWHTWSSLYELKKIKNQY